MPFRLIRHRSRTVLLALAAVLVASPPAHAVSCTTGSQMTAAQRDHLVQVSRSFAAEVQAGNTAAVRQATIASVAAQFDGVASSIQAVAPQIQTAALTINDLYLLQATDLKSAQDTQFFCSLPGSSLIVTITIPQLPPGNYALVLMRATGVEHPQHISLILENDPPGTDDWKLAGFFVRPITAAGHDGVWYWTAARNYAQKNQAWNAYFYYQTAAFLLNPVDFISSPNLEKLQKEMQTMRPADVPGANPLVLKADGQSFDITSIRTDTFSGNLDLVINYTTKDVSDPVATHTQILELMKAMLAQHPELRQAFHGLWVYAHAQNQSPYAIELPMSQIT